MGLEVIFLIAFRKITLIGRQHILSRDLAIAGNGPHFAAADHIMKFLKTSFIGVVVRFEIEVLPFVLASIAKRIGRRRWRVAAENSSWVVENGTGVSYRDDKRKGENFRPRHGWRRVVATRMRRYKVEKSERNASIELKMAIDFICIMILPCRSSQQQGKSDESFLALYRLDFGPAEARRMPPQPTLQMKPRMF